MTLQAQRLSCRTCRRASRIKALSALVRAYFVLAIVGLVLQGAGADEHTGTIHHRHFGEVDISIAGEWRLARHAEEKRAELLGGSGAVDRLDLAHHDRRADRAGDVRDGVERKLAGLCLRHGDAAVRGDVPQRVRQAPDHFRLDVLVYHARPRAGGGRGRGMDFDLGLSVDQHRGPDRLDQLRAGAGEHGRNAYRARSTRSASR